MRVYINAGLPDAKYLARINPDSIPEGYALDDLRPKPVQAQPSEAGRVEFTLRAFRTVSGRVTVRDRATGRKVPLANATVQLQKLSLECHTDKAGAYWFRNLPVGTFTIVVTHNGREFSRQVTLPESPAILKNIDFDVGIDRMTETAQNR